LAGSLHGRPGPFHHTYPEDRVPRASLYSFCILEGRVLCPQVRCCEPPPTQLFKTYNLFSSTSVMLTGNNGHHRISGVCCGVLKPRLASAGSQPTRPHQRRSAHTLETHAIAPFDADTYCWTGTDEFTHLDDRKAQPPLPLPEIDSPKRIVLVRHGQSTWNAEGRIQGSTNFAVLTPKGQAQAATTYQMVCLCNCLGTTPTVPRAVHAQLVS
jgi:hypothetical protein